MIRSLLLKGTKSSLILFISETKSHKGVMLISKSDKFLTNIFSQTDSDDEDDTPAAKKLGPSKVMYA